MSSCRATNAKGAGATGAWRRTRSSASGRTRGARRLAIAIELLDAGWTPARTGWDDPSGKHLDCPQWRALTIARRDGR
jgi:hypothetical protein